MKKYFIISIMLIFILFPLSAQKSKDVLYLKNGSIIYGTILEITDAQYKIQTSMGNIFVFPAAEVDKFITDTSGYNGRKKDGSGFAIEAGVLAGAQSTDYHSPFSFNFIGTLTHNTYNSFGLGSGVEFLGQTYMPVFLEYKVLFSPKQTTPFFFMRGGGLVHLKGDFESIDATYPQYNTPRSYKGGFSFTVGTGISWDRPDFETYLSCAYRNAHTSYEELNSNNHTVTYKNSYNRLEIKLGFRF